MIATVRIISADVGFSELNEHLLMDGFTGSMADCVKRAFQRDKSERVQHILLAFGGYKANKRGIKKETTIKEICEIADEVRRGMGRFNMLDNNCQHFCNNVLQRLGLQTERTTIGPTTTPAHTHVHECNVHVDDVTEVFEMSCGEDGGTKG